MPITPAVGISVGGPGGEDPCGSTHVLAIGIDAYVHHKQLRNCVRDVSDLVQRLTTTYNVDEGQVTLLLDADATRSNILIALDNYTARLTETESLIIIYAGHGLLRNGIGSWLPVDAQYFYDNLNLSTLHDFLEPIPARHILIIADACFPDRLFSTTRAGEILEGLEAQPSRYALTSGRDGPVLDGPAGENSPFAVALKRRLASATGSLGIVMLSEQVREDVERYTEKAQIPRHDYLHVRGNKHGQFFFRRKQGATLERDLFLEAYRAHGGMLFPPDELRRIATHFDRYDAMYRAQSPERQKELRRLNTVKYLSKWGLDIKVLKDRLARLGYYHGGIDSEYTEDLADGLARFQESRMLKQVDGFFGELTYREMVHALVERGAAWS